MRYSSNKKVGAACFAALILGSSILSNFITLLVPVSFLTFTDRPNAFDAVYKRYRALPEEKDSWEVEDSVSAAYTTNRAPKKP